MEQTEITEQIEIAFVLHLSVPSVIFVCSLIFLLSFQLEPRPTSKRTIHAKLH